MKLSGWQRVSIILLMVWSVGLMVIAHISPDTLKWFDNLIGREPELAEIQIKTVIAMQKEVNPSSVEDFSLEALLGCKKFNYDRYPDDYQARCAVSNDSDTAWNIVQHYDDSLLSLSQAIELVQKRNPTADFSYVLAEYGKRVTSLPFDRAMFFLKAIALSMTIWILPVVCLVLVIRFLVAVFLWVIRGFAQAD